MFLLLPTPTFSYLLFYILLPSLLLSPTLFYFLLPSLLPSRLLSPTLFYFSLPSPTLSILSPTFSTFLVWSHTLTIPYFPQEFMFQCIMYQEFNVLMFLMFLKRWEMFNSFRINEQKMFFYVNLIDINNIFHIFKISPNHYTLVYKWRKKIFILTNAQILIICNIFLTSPTFGRRQATISTNIFPFHATRVFNSVARKCTQLFSNCAQFLEINRARNCAQVKFTCVGNPPRHTLGFCFPWATTKRSSMPQHFSQLLRFQMVNLVHWNCVFCKILTRPHHAKCIYKDFYILVLNTGCPTKHDSWWIVLNVFFHTLYYIY